jgi:hypothetical protein
VYAKNPDSTPLEKHYPSTGITLGLTAVEEERPGQVPLLKLYDAFDPSVVRSSSGPDPIAANYTATLGLDLSQAVQRVSQVAAGLSAVDSKPASVGRIKTSHLISTFSGWV